MLQNKIPFQISNFEADQQLIGLYNNNKIENVSSNDSDYTIAGCNTFSNFNPRKLKFQLITITKKPIFINPLLYMIINICIGCYWLPYFLIITYC